MDISNYKNIKVYDSNERGENYVLYFLNDERYQVNVTETYKILKIIPGNTIYIIAVNDVNDPDTLYHITKRYCPCKLPKNSAEGIDLSKDDNGNLKVLLREHYIGKKVDPEYMLPHVDSWLEVEDGEHAVQILNSYVVTKVFEQDLHSTFKNSRNKFNDENLTKNFIQKMLYESVCNLQYLKAAKLLHRNLNEKSIHNVDGSIKFGSFNYARGMPDNCELTSYIGTNELRSLEHHTYALNQDKDINYSYESDMFLVGLAMFKILTGKSLYELISGTRFSGGTTDSCAILNLLKILPFKKEISATRILRKKFGMDHKKISEDFRNKCTRDISTDIGHKKLEKFRQDCVRREITDPSKFFYSFIKFHLMKRFDRLVNKIDITFVRKLATILAKMLAANPKERLKTEDLLKEERTKEYNIFEDLDEDYKFENYIKLKKACKALESEKETFQDKKITAFFVGHMSERNAHSIFRILDINESSNSNEPNDIFGSNCLHSNSTEPDNIFVSNCSQNSVQYRYSFNESNECIRGYWLCN